MMKTQGKNQTNDCDPATGCCPEESVQVGNKVYTNTNGGSGMSDHVKALIAKRDKKIKTLADLKIIQKKT